MDTSRNKVIKVAITTFGLLVMLGLTVLTGQRVLTILTRAENNSPQNVQVTEVLSNQAKVTYTTQNEVQGIIEYGTNPSNLTLFAPETLSTTDHKISLSLLTPNTTYYFHMKIGEKIYDNAGLPYTFITKAGEVNVSPNNPIPTSSSAFKSFPTAIPTIFSAVNNCNVSDFQRHYGAMKGTANYDQNYDVDNNGIINVADYALCQKRTK